MSRSAFVVPGVVFMLSLVFSHTPPRQHGERRIGGTVIDAQATYCEPKKEQGCTGTVLLDVRGGRSDDPVAVHVPLGTPISAGCEPLAFGRLEGRRVVVTEVDDGPRRIARAISATDGPRDGAC